VTADSIPLRRRFMSIRKRFSGFSTIPYSAALVCAFSVAAAPANAAFHLWQIQEIYSNSSGTLQFIELFDSNGGQNFVGGQKITVFNVGKSQSNAFTLPAGTLPGSSLNHHLLFGTSGIKAAGAPTPD